jgi:large subunit ribosomal protein L27e
MKAGRVVIMLAGRRAGKKAVIIKPYDEGSKKGGKNFPHALVAGVEREPLKVHKRMKKDKIVKRSRVKPFVKYVNYNHLIPTRFQVGGEFGSEELKKSVNETSMANAASRKAVKEELKKVFTERYNNPEPESEKQPNVDFFFKKLRF